MYTENIKEYLKKHGFKAFTPKAVLFDMDGVIYDSMPNHAISWHKAMAEYGLDMPLAGAYQYEGMRGVETIKLLTLQQRGKKVSDEEAKIMYAKKSRIYAECPEAGKMEGTYELMCKIKDMGLKIVVVTGSGQKTLLDRLLNDFHGLITPELLVTAKDVEHGKPNPEPYIAGMKKAGIHPWEGIVVENAPLGVRAGVAAKLFTIAVNTGPLPDNMLIDEGSNILFHRMTDLESAWNSDWIRVTDLNIK